MTVGTILRLGRVSNLPTVWTNALAGAVLAELEVSLATVALAALALTLFYEGGMWLNDAFDAEIDARERANRPIPNGEIARGTVFVGGFVMLGAGIALSFTLGFYAGLAGISLAGAVVAYDWLHKQVSFGPVLMGLTRFLSYALAAFAVGWFTDPALFGALGLFAWVIGLTYAAKQEAYDRIGATWPLLVLALPLTLTLERALPNLVTTALWVVFAGVTAYALRRLFRRGPGDVPKAVVMMIAAISLYDAVLIGATGATILALIAAAGFVLTLALQRVASGT